MVDGAPFAILEADVLERGHKLEAHSIVQLVARGVREGDLAVHRANALQLQQREHLVVNLTTHAAAAMVRREVYRQFNGPSIRRALVQAARVGVANRHAVFLAHNVRIHAHAIDDALAELLHRGSDILERHSSIDVRRIDGLQNLGVVGRSQAEGENGLRHRVPFDESG